MIFFLVGQQVLPKPKPLVWITKGKWRQGKTGVLFNFRGGHKEESPVENWEIQKIRVQVHNMRNHNLHNKVSHLDCLRDRSNQSSVVQSVVQSCLREISKRVRCNNSFFFVVFENIICMRQSYTYSPYPCQLILFTPWTGVLSYLKCAGCKLCI